MWQTKAIDISLTDFLASKANAPYFRDALAAPLSKKALAPGHIQINIFSHMPSWINKLMALRNRLVSVFGFKVGQTLSPSVDIELNVGDAAGFMTVIYRDEHEIISFAEDKHMQFYLSVSKQNGQAVISTLVNKKTFIGRVYVTAIIPFHWFIARAVINNAVKNQRI